MKISSVNKGMGNRYFPSSAKVKKTKEFSEFLDTSQREHREQYLSKMLHKIKEAGKRVKETHSSVEAAAYKRYIAEFLNFVLSQSYAVKHIHGLQGQLSVVEVINRELDQLMKSLLADEEKNIAIANRVDYITGLLLDLCT